MTLKVTVWKSLFWWAVIMFSWRQQTLNRAAQVVKPLNWTGSVKVRDITITEDFQADSEPVQLFHIQCVSASYSFTFRALVRISSYSCCVDCERFLLWPWVWKRIKTCVLELWVNMNKRCFTYFLNIHSSHSFNSSPVILPRLQYWQLYVQATDCTESVSAY